MLSDWPPSKPISIRTCSAMGHHLREDAVDGIGVNERDLQAEEPRVRLRVDELGAIALQRLERRPDVRNLEGDVVHPGPAGVQEAPHRGVVLEGGEELDAAATDEDRRRLDALLGDSRPMLELGAEEARVRP